MVQCGIVWYSLVQSGKKQYRVVKNGQVQNDTESYKLVQSSKEQQRAILGLYK